MAGGYFVVGKLKPGGVAYICEGIGTAWACWQATGASSVVCFGAGSMGKVAKALLQQDAAARLVLVPDVGKESDAQQIALEVGALVANMPHGEASNFDANDLAKRDGLDALKALLSKATLPSKAEPRYKLLNATDLREMPPLAWRVRGVLPAVG
jgi:putative DNA primase/helicase